MIKSQILVFLFHLWANVWRFEILFVSLWHICKNQKLLVDMMKRQFILGVMMTAALGMSAQKAMNPPAGGKAISDELIGIFFEDTLAWTTGSTRTIPPICACTSSA